MKRRKRILAVVGILLLLWYLPGWLLRLVPLPSNMFEKQTESLTFVDRNGRPLRKISEKIQSEDRVKSPPSKNSSHDLFLLAELDQIPENLIQSTLIAEDRRFWEHHGIDGRATIRALSQLIRNRKIISGGSTVTQQLIKLAKPRPRTISTKITEMLQACRLEQIWSKQRIIREYLNRVDYGNRCIGCTEASAYYFGKPLKDLSWAEAAFLAGLPQAPSRLNPHRHYERARKRQEWILKRLFEAGIINQTQLTGFLKQSIQLMPRGRTFEAPHFVDLAFQLGSNQKKLSGLIRTTIDLDLNSKVEKIVQSFLAPLKELNVHDAAAVILDNRSGDLLALVGSEDFFGPESGQINGAWIPRAAGSTLKPFVYGMALEQGANCATMIPDIPSEFSTPTGLFTPVNYNRKCYGPVTIRIALANSLNIPAVKILNQVGGPSAFKKWLLDFGITSLNQDADYYGLGMVIGNAEVRLLELVNAYACLARLGEYLPFRIFLDDPTLAQRTPHKVISKENSWLIADILSDNQARSTAFGSDSSLRFDFPVACKTGTSTGFRDNWAIGYVPEFTIGVWIGNFGGTPMEGVSGVTGAAPILHELILLMHRQYPFTWYQKPLNCIIQPMNPRTGKIMNSPSLFSVLEKFFPPALPSHESANDYDLHGRAYLGNEYRSWYETATDSSIQSFWAIHPTMDGKLTITSPLPGSTYFLDPDLPAEHQRLYLRASENSSIIWQSQTLHFQTKQGNTFLYLRPGRHVITASNQLSGFTTSTWFWVKEP